VKVPLMLADGPHTLCFDFGAVAVLARDHGLNMEALFALVNSTGIEETTAQIVPLLRAALVHETDDQPRDERTLKGLLRGVGVFYVITQVRTAMTAAFHDPFSVPAAVDAVVSAGVDGTLPSAASTPSPSSVNPSAVSGA
jgi:hypothetical protein